MGHGERLVKRCKDGTVKHWNFFTGRQACTVPGRDRRPNLCKPTDKRKRPLSSRALERARGLEAFCNFCAGRYANTPPERARFVKGGAVYRLHEHLTAEEALSSPASFRCMANLFEIMPLSYWQENYDYRPPEEILEWQADYLGDRKGRNHVARILTLKRTGRVPRRIPKISLPELKARSLPLFAGSHELIVPRRHLKNHARYREDLCSAGDLTPQEHLAYLKFTISAVSRIMEFNPHAAYVALFQNWLKPAGASFEHLHKQLVGTDDWGPHVQAALAGIQSDRRAFVRYLEALEREGLVIAANDHAVAAADTGQTYPTVILLCRTPAPSLAALDEGALQGLSDLLHACHAAWDRQVPANEEWRYTPRGAVKSLPVHILLKWRVNTPAGFEGATGIQINPIDPPALREWMVDRLRVFRAKNPHHDFQVGEECSL